MYPHERSLVKKLAGKPFALLGVNSDPDRKKLQEIVKKEQITWRSWSDGQSGPIARRWHVSSWPTIWVLDAAGVIRFKDVHGKELDEAVEKLLREMENTKTP